MEAADATECIQPKQHHSRAIIGGDVPARQSAAFCDAKVPERLTSLDAEPKDWAP